MNLKLHLNLTTIPTAAGKFLLRWRGLIIAIIAISMIGYAGYLVSKLVNLPTDQVYVDKQRDDLDKSKIKFDKGTITIINGLNQVNPQVDLTNVGKSNPFAP